MLPASPVIARLKVRANRSADAAFRLALQRELSGTEVRLCGPPSQILLIRSLSDPVPGCVGAGRIAFAPDPRWQRGLHDRIETMRARAVRPAGGKIPIASDAILFEDEAHLRACLAVALVERADPLAWWRAVLARYVCVDTLRSLFLDRPELLPATLAVLARWHDEERVVQSLSDAEVGEITEQLTRAHGIASIVGPASVNQRPVAEPAAPASGARAAAGEADESSGWQKARPQPSESPERDTSSGPVACPCAPWHRFWAPSSGAALSLQRQYLLGLALSLHEQPGYARSIRYAREAQFWLTAMSARVGPVPSPARAVDGETARPSPSSSRHPAAEHESHAPVARIERDLDPVAHAMSREPHSQAASAKPADEPAPAKTVAAQSVADAGEARGRIEPEATSATRTDPATRGWPAEGIQTQWGGFIYLINLFEQLGLPECFEAQCSLASGAGTLRALRAVVQALLPARVAACADDPIWKLLDALCGADSFSDQMVVDALSLPPEWVSVLPQEALAAVASEHARTMHAGRSGCAPLSRWAEFVAPFLSWRMALALGKSAADELDLWKEVLRCPARIFVTDLHIDVVMSLESIRLPLRMAGLDRSPGWVRSLQRVVLIHYE